MNNKKQVKTAFNELLNKSVKSDWGALESSLQPQNFTLAVPRKSRLKLAYAAASFVMLTAIVAVAASTAINRSEVKILPTLGGDNNTSMASSASKGSLAAGLAKKQSSTAKTGGTAKLVVPSMKLAMMPYEPQILGYNHKLYITNTVFAAKETASHQNLIGHISFGTNVPVYDVKNVDTAKSICLLSTYEDTVVSSNTYLKYNYLCDDSFTVQGRTYRLVTGNDSSFYSVAPSVIIKNTKENRDTKNNYFVKWDFQCQFSIVLKSVKAILGSEVGKLPSGGTIYSIDEIDPSQAVYVNIGKNWFLITKANGYSGKTVNDVMKDKGIERPMF